MQPQQPTPTATPPAHAGTSSEIPIAPSLVDALDDVGVEHGERIFDERVPLVCALAAAAGVAAAFVAPLLTRLIAAVTNLSFYGRLSVAPASPWANALGPAVIAVPALGGLIVGLMARFGSEKIRGHGIPEAMEQVLTNESRIAPRLTWLKPVSAAIAIGTGGPFGAEGPIIATGGALGSLIGQRVRVTAEERKTLLAAGAAAGMTAIFGTPVSAVLLAVELLLFELRPGSLVPVAIASSIAGALRYLLVGGEPFFAMPAAASPHAAAIAVYAAVGAIAGLAAVGVTRLVYATEDAFAKLPVHWMWWPALGGLVVGLVGWIEPRTLGVGYENISDVLSGRLVLGGVALVCGLKFVSWTIALASGTSGGTLAPLFTVGGGLGALLGAAAAALLPEAGADPRVAALVGMAALFGGASRAFLASVVFCLETTLEPHAILPLLAGGTASMLVAGLLAPTTIMTEKIARRGVRVPSVYVPDFLDSVLLRDGATHEVVSLRAEQTIESALAWLRSRERGARHQGFPLLDARGALAGFVTAREIAEAPDPAAPLATLARRRVVTAYEDETLRRAADRMVDHDVGRLPVVSRREPLRVVGIVTRSDLLAAHRRRLAARRLG
jgi:H+/Cl- antiporter ClcA/CBS domain-containing protein